MIEDQESISAWADQTFGPASSNARVAARANEGMAELLRALIADDNHAKAAEKVANGVIVLCRLMTRMAAISAKSWRARWRSIARGNGTSRPTATATTSATRRTPSGKL